MTTQFKNGQRSKYYLKIIKCSNFLVGIKKKFIGLMEASPCLVKLYLQDNDIYGKGKENGLLEFTQIFYMMFSFVYFSKLGALVKSCGQ